VAFRTKQEKAEKKRRNSAWADWYMTDPKSAAAGYASRSPPDRCIYRASYTVKNTAGLRRWTAIATLNVGISQRTLQRWCVGGKIRARKLGRCWFVYVPELKRLFGVTEDA